MTGDASRSEPRIAYLTDVEGRWDKLASFTEGNADVWLSDGELQLADGVTLVFGGDVCDRGPHARAIVSVLLAARRTYGERVVLLAGNRDINKLRLLRELRGEPPPRTPTELRSGPRGALLRWILAHTMGAKEAYEHRRTELRASGVRDDDDAVVESFLDDVRPGGLMLAYLAAARLAFRAARTLFVHGGITSESLGAVPDRPERMRTIDAWLAGLGEFYETELAAFSAGRAPEALLAYQAPRPGTMWNQSSVVYGRLADEHANPTLPEPAVVDALRDAGISRLVVGHTPSGDCPAILRDAGFELVLADNSYGRIERGARVSLSETRTSIEGLTELDDGTRAKIRFSTALDDDRAPLGRRDARTGQLVKAQLESGEYLLFRGLAGRRVEQTSATESELARRSLVPPRR